MCGGAASSSDRLLLPLPLPLALSVLFGHHYHQRPWKRADRMAHHGTHALGVAMCALLAAAATTPPRLP